MITSVASTRYPELSSMPSSPERQATKAMAQALRAGDVDAARSAYADMIRLRPEGSTWQADSPFAQLGQALVKGDMDAARAAFANRFTRTVEPLPPSTRVVPPVVATGSAAASATAGAPGSLLNTVA